MYELKFRAWDIERQRMIGGCCNLLIGMDGVLWWQFGNSIDVLGTPMKNERAKYILMQYKGLIDKNNIMIYPDDYIKINVDWLYKREGSGYDAENVYHDPVELIVLVKDRNSLGTGGIIKKVTYDKDEYKDCAPFEKNRWFHMKPSRKENYEVIGNIYDNPELLEKK